MRVGSWGVVVQAGLLDEREDRKRIFLCVAHRITDFVDNSSAKKKKMLLFLRVDMSPVTITPPQGKGARCLRVFVRWQSSGPGITPKARIWRIERGNKQCDFLTWVLVVSTTSLSRTGPFVHPNKRPQRAMVRGDLNVHHGRFPLFMLARDPHTC